MTGPVVAAVDVGGTTIKGAVVDADGTTLARTDRAVAEIAPDGLVGAVIEQVRLVVDRAQDLGGAVAVGLAVPGVVDEAAGVGRYSMILGWASVPFVDLLTPLGLPVAFGHDVSAGAYAEARWGAARGRTDWLFLALGTGLGSTFVLGGRPYRGSNGTGGELAHVVVRPDGPVCRCGKRGCLEMVATYVESMNPSVVVVGGGVGRAGGLLVDRLAAELRPRIRFADPPPAVLAARFGADAALVGVAARAQELAASGAAFGVPFLPDDPRPLPTRPRTAAGDRP